jgi:hypothetical protein
MEENNSISFCGLDCSVCKIRESVGCDGCRNMETPYWDGDCEIRDCAGIKRIENCSYCKEFPCELLLDISLDPDTGDDGDRIDTLRLMLDARQSEKTRALRRTIIGACIGVVAGLLLSGFFGGGLDWFYALAGGDYRTVIETPEATWIYVFFGVVAGTAVPWIIEWIKRYYNNGKN